MADVASEAGVSRQTLYNTFGAREQLGQALLLREIAAFLSDVEDAISAVGDDPEAALEAAFAAFLRGARENPLVRAIVVEDDPDLLAFVIAQGVTVVDTASEQLAGMIAVRWPQAAHEDVRLLAHALVRLAISYAAIPEPGKDVPADVRRLLAPFVKAALP